MKEVKHFDQLSGGFRSSQVYNSHNLATEIQKIPNQHLCIKIRLSSMLTSLTHSTHVISHTHINSLKALTHTTLTVPKCRAIPLYEAPCQTGNISFQHQHEFLEAEESFFT